MKDLRNVAAIKLNSVHGVKRVGVGLYSLPN